MEDLEIENTMNIDVVENPEKELVAFLGNKIDEFNRIHWKSVSQKPLVVQIKNASGKVVAGATARSFGNWLLLDILWVSDELRGKGLGTRILEKIEQAGKSRGCKKCLLDTLEFQAMPFYQRHGYEIAWKQESYPEKGCKYFMVKEL